MTAPAHKVLNDFDALEPAEKQQVAVEILRRSSGLADLSDQARDELASELFCQYDREEEQGGGH